MSVEAISRALNLAPVPADRGGQPSSACKVVLVGLANHAGPDGSGAFPAVHTLMRYTGLSERTVRACLGRLEAAGLIRPCDPGGRGGADQAGRPAAEGVGPGPDPDGPSRGGRGAASRRGLAAFRRRLLRRRVQSPHPVDHVDNPASGVQRLHPNRP